jgi:hypothetical protein
MQACGRSSAADHRHGDLREATHCSDGAEAATREVPAASRHHRDAPTPKRHGDSSQVAQGRMPAPSAFNTVDGRLIQSFERGPSPRTAAPLAIEVGTTEHQAEDLEPRVRMRGEAELRERDLPRLALRPAGAVERDPDHPPNSDANLAAVGTSGRRMSRPSSIDSPTRIRLACRSSGSA